MSQFLKPVILDESTEGGGDPWFNRITALSEVEGESRETVSSRGFLDPVSRPGPRAWPG
jgi:hypothetical protein